jgi:tRNA(fMet)-specific endonuclease VapC
LLDTNVISVVRHPHGWLADRIAAVGEQHVCTSIIVAQNCLWPVRMASVRLAAQLEAVLAAIDVLALETSVDGVYGELRARLERAGQSIGANDLLIAAHALTLGHTVVTDNEREFSRIVDLRIENWLR